MPLKTNYENTYPRILEFLEKRGSSRVSVISSNLCVSRQMVYKYLWMMHDNDLVENEPKKILLRKLCSSSTQTVQFWRKK